MTIGLRLCFFRSGRTNPPPTAYVTGIALFFSRTMQLNIEKEVAALRRMTAGQLREHYAKLFGEESRSSHKTYLIRKIAWRLQAKAEGDLSIRARRRAEQLANDAKE